MRILIELIGGRILKVLLRFVGLSYVWCCPLSWSLVVLSGHESSFKTRVTFGRTGRGVFSSKKPC